MAVAIYPARQHEPPFGRNLLPALRQAYADGGKVTVLLPPWSTLPKDMADRFVKQTGIRKWTWFIKNGKGTDGTPYDLAGRYDRNEIDKMAIKNLADSVYDNDAYENLGPQGGTPEALTMQKVQDLMTQSVTKVIIAKSEADANATYDKMLADMKAAGSEKVEKVINDNYQERLSLWK